MRYSQAVNFKMRIPGLVALLVLLMLQSVASAQLTADDLALVVNKRQPAGRELAELYAKTRGVPANRIIEIDVPDAMQIDYNTMQRLIATPIKDQLSAQNLTTTVRCLVLFYGVPLRMGDPLPGEARGFEKAAIERQLERATSDLTQTVTGFEKLAREFDTKFVPQGDETVPSMMQRAAKAEQIIVGSIPKIADAQARQDVSKRYRDLTRLVLPASSQPATRPTNAAIQKLVSDVDRPLSRQQARDAIGNFGSLAERLSLLLQHKRFLEIDDMRSAVDSELSLLYVPEFQRMGFLQNPLYFRSDALRGGNVPSVPTTSPSVPPRVMMVARIDAPTPELARKIITDSIVVENAGLKGTVVIDARGLTSNDGYGNYDQTLRNLASLVRDKTKLTLLFDDKPELFSDNSTTDAMIYCGWYSVRQYRPFGKVVPGSVGYHIASYELLDLRPPGESGWVSGLMRLGIGATMGSVEEPYLVAFPRPDEFFPLLLADRMTLAEAFWRTQMVSSWRMVLIGDPLYRPFRQNPPLSLENLPGDLARIKPVVQR